MSHTSILGALLVCATAFTSLQAQDRCATNAYRAANPGLVQQGSMQNEYLSTARDLPRMELSFKGKTIRFHKQKAPEALLLVMTMLDEITFAQVWEAAN